MAQHVLITGATGLIGRRLSALLLQKGYQVSHLGRSASEGSVPSYRWDVKRKMLAPGALENCDAIVHLAGANLANTRWTDRWKKEILESRTQTTQLLYEALSRGGHRVKTLVCASAIGLYGFGDQSRVFTESDPPAPDFLATVVREWEAAAARVGSLGIRVVKVRTGIVLSDKGGALKRMATPVRWGVGAPLAGGDQRISWIHIDDVCGIFMHALENPGLSGAYNAVAPHDVSNRELTQRMASILHRPLWLPHVPALVLRIMLGEIAEQVIHGSRVSADKIMRSGYAFRFPDLDGALEDLLLR